MSALAALVPGVNADALGAGFFFGAIATCVSWWALLGLSLLRRLLTDAVE
jgi:hypothetical protein